MMCFFPDSIGNANAEKKVQVHKSFNPETTEVKKHRRKTQDFHGQSRGETAALPPPASD